MASMLAWLRGLRTWFEDVETAVQRMAEAEACSQQLLRSWLSPEQLAQYDTLGHFIVVGPDTGRRYRISRGRVFNIQELHAGGTELCTWCFAPEDVATGDVNLAQKIALENFETKALGIANRSSLLALIALRRPCRQAPCVAER
jgi:hypothetical protein